MGLFYVKGYATERAYNLGSMYLLEEFDEKDIAKSSAEVIKVSGNYCSIVEDDEGNVIRRIVYNKKTENYTCYDYFDKIHVDVINKLIGRIIKQNGINAVRTFRLVGGGEGFALVHQSKKIPVTLDSE